MNNNARSLANKIDSFDWLIECHQPSIICVTESWLNDSVLDVEILPPGYVILRKDRLSGRGGGVALFIKNHIDFSLLPDLPNTESIWCKLKISGQAIAVGAIYRPPNETSDVFTDITNYILDRKLHLGKLILTGDFNAPCID